MSVSTVLQPTVSVTLVEGEGYTTGMFHTPRFTLVHVLVLCSEVDDVSSGEVYVVSKTACERGQVSGGKFSSQLDYISF